MNTNSHSATSRTGSMVVITGDILVARYSTAFESVQLKTGSLDHWRSTVERTPGCLGILEVDQERPDFETRVQTAHSLSLHRPDSIFFAIIPQHQAEIEHGLRQAGFAAVFWSLTQVQQFNQYTRKHFKSVPECEAGIEEAVRHNLPWSP